MLSSQSWTVLDTFCTAVLILLSLRLFAGEVDAHDPAEWYVAEVLRAEEMLPEVTNPLPVATQWVATHGTARLDAALRCIGLAEVRVVNACARRHNIKCGTAKAELRQTERVLWPQGRTNDLSTAMRQRADLYASAYFGLSTDGTEPMRSSSQLIRDRDGAMCRQYLQFTEAPLHGSKI